MEQFFFQGLILYFKALLSSLIKKWKRRTILHSLLYTTSKTLSAWGRENLVASWKKPQSVCKHHGSQKTQRNLSGAPWLGYLCRVVIHFLFVFTVSAWSTQEFTVPVALWSFWWIPNSPQWLSHVNVKSHLHSGALSSGGTWNRNQHIFEGSCHGVVGCSWGPRWLRSILSPELQMSFTILFMEGQLQHRGLL